MIPSFVKRLSNSLHFGTTSQDDGQRGNRDSDEDITTLRRQSTRELLSDTDDSNSAIRHTSRVSAVRSVREATKSLSKRGTKSIVTASSVISKRTSTITSSLQCRNQTVTSASSKRKLVTSKSSLTKGENSKESSVTKRSSFTKAANSKETSVTKQSSLTKAAKSKESSLTKRISLTKTATSKQSSINKQGSLTKGKKQDVNHISKRKKLTNGKQLWFPRGEILAVRSENANEYYLCRNRNNIYNFTKEAPIRWLDVPRRQLNPCLYKRCYVDKIDPASILMQVTVTPLPRGLFELSKEQHKEIMKVLKFIQDVDQGDITMEEVDDDVETVIQIEEPPKKKPRLHKTASQKLRDKAKNTALKKSSSKTKAKPKGEAKKEPKRKKATPRQPKEDPLALKPRPDVKVLTEDPLFESRTHMPYVSKTANSRLVFRAIHFKDNKYLKKLLKDDSRIYQLYCKSVNNDESPLMAAAKAKDVQVFTTLLKEYFGDTFKERLKIGHGDSCQLDTMDVGRYNQRSLGIRFIRNIQASRGSREGNNAFNKNESCYRPCESDFLLDLAKAEVDPAIMRACAKFFKEDGLDIYSNISNSRICDLLLAGQNKIVAHLVKRDLGNWHSGFTQLYHQVLDFTTEELTSCPPSQVRNVNKRCNKLTPVHCAATNPNAKYLEKVLSAQPDVSVADRFGRRPIHYAAGCKSPEPLRVLLQWGANANDADNQRFIPLHYAIKANRPDNVKFLLESAKTSGIQDMFAQKFGVGGVNRPVTSSYTPLHLAVERDFLEVARVLIDKGANVNSKLNVSMMGITPLMLAAERANLDMVKFLISKGAVVEQQDRLGRSAVIHACKNGATKVLSYLIHIGANFERPDTSGNTPIHYAAAYGWLFTVRLLMEAGAEPNVCNMWQATPVSIAYLKANIGIVRELLNSSKVDVNFQDNNGLTLLFNACASDLSQTDLIDQIRFMVEEKGSLCTLKSIHGETPLHYLVCATASDSEKLTEAFQQSVEIAKLLVKHGCDLHAVDNTDSTALMKAFGQGRNLELAEALLKMGCKVLPPSPGDPTTSVLHQISEQLASSENSVKAVNLMIKHKYKEELKAMAQYVDRSGYTPLLRACRTYINMRYTDEQINLRNSQKRVWENTRDFIRVLVTDLGSDVNAEVDKQFFELEDMPAPNSTSWYNEYKFARRTAVGIVAEFREPEWNANGTKKSDSCGTIFKMLVKQGADLNRLDKNGQSALSYLIMNNQSELIKFAAQEGKCDINLCNEVQRNNKTVQVAPIFLGCSVNTDTLITLIENGTNVNAKNEADDQRCLHVLIANKKPTQDILQVIEYLAKYKYNFNAVDRKKCTVLHYAVRANEGSMDSSFEVEVKLIQLGVKLALQDHKGRTALHLVLKKTPRRGYFSYRQEAKDPVELLKLIGREMSKSEVNIQDMSGRTALHSAAKMGATICCMYLMMIGANVNIKDKDGNTALSLAVLNGHDGCATTLIQSGSDLRTKVVSFSPEEQQRRKAKKKKTITRVNEDDDDEVDDEHSVDDEEDWLWKPLTKLKKEDTVKTEALYKVSIEKNLNGVSMFVMEAGVTKSGLQFLDAINIALETCKYNIVLRILTTLTDLGVFLELSPHGRNLLHMLALSTKSNPNPRDFTIIKIAEFLIGKRVPIDIGDDYRCSPIQYAILNRHYDLANYLASSSGGYKTKYTDGFNRSYIAAALWKCYTKGIDSSTWDFIEKLVKAKANINQAFDFPVDPDLASLRSNDKLDPDYWISYPNSTTTPLIVAITLCDDFNISHNFLKWGSNPNHTDGRGITPLMHAVMQNKLLNVKQLLNYDFDPNKVDQEEKKVETTKKKKSSASHFRLTARANSYSDDEDSNDEDDDDDEDVDEEKEEAERKKKEKERKKALKEFKPVKKTSPVNLAMKDSEDRTALHYVTKSSPSGTFDNPEMAFVLVKAGAKNVKDKHGVTPFMQAVESGAHQVAHVLKTHFTLSGPVHTKFERDFHVNDCWSSGKGLKPEFMAAADKVLRRYESSMEVEDKYVHEVDSNCNVTNGTLVKDEELDMFYDVLMTKVDVKQGEWGLYNFYQIQLIHVSVKNLYILFTRWGRIEDNGQFQHTPFSDKALAVKEFMKIFREKTGNKWPEVKNFVRKPRKYRLVEDIARKAPPTQKDVDIDLETTVESTLPKYLRFLVNIMMNPKKMQLSMKNTSGLNTESLPFGQLNKERLLQGKHLLDHIDKILCDVEKYRELKKDEQDGEKKELYQQNLEKIAELSNEYFHVIPQKNFSCEKIRPLDKRQALMTHIYNLTNLLNFEVASKMILGAMAQKKSVHPLDYVYRCMDCQIQLMNKEEEMVQTILHYICSGAQCEKVQAIYKLSRQGEEERLEATGLENRRYLWHGSSTCNLISILSRGLLVSPPEARQTAWRFGKGIYFSDRFEKSKNYIRSSDSPKFMLLCEVALGKVKYFSHSDEDDDDDDDGDVENGGKKKTKDPEDWNSIIARGSYGYRDQDWFILPSGISIPQGTMGRHYDSYHRYHSDSTEYIVSDPAQVCMRYLIQFK